MTRAEKKAIEYQWWAEHYYHMAMIYSVWNTGDHIVRRNAVIGAQLAAAFYEMAMRSSSYGWGRKHYQSRAAYFSYAARVIMGIE